MTQMRRQTNMKYERGFTLVEMLLASGIFAGVLLVGFATLSQSNDVQDRTEAQRTIQQANRLIFEAIGREARLANGLLRLEPDGQLVSQSPHSPITFLRSGLPVPGAAPDTLATGDGLAIDTTNLTTGLQERRFIQLIERSGDGEPPLHGLAMTICTDPPVCAIMQPPVPLSPEGIDIVAVEFSGLQGSQLDPRSPAPFVAINLTSRSLVATRGMSIQQTARTVVTIRNYPTVSSQ